jgi:hypothetical protein
VWADGTAEPADWLYVQTGWTGRTSGAPSLNGSSAGDGSATVSFADVEVWAPASAEPDPLFTDGFDGGDAGLLAGIIDPQTGQPITEVTLGPDGTGVVWIRSKGALSGQSPTPFTSITFVATEVSAAGAWLPGQVVAQAEPQSQNVKLQITEHSWWTRTKDGVLSFFGGDPQTAAGLATNVAGGVLIVWGTSAPSSRTPGGAWGSPINRSAHGINLVVGPFQPGTVLLFCPSWSSTTSSAGPIPWTSRSLT